MIRVKGPVLTLDLSGARPAVRLGEVEIDGVGSAMIDVQPGELPVMVLRLNAFAVVIQGPGEQRREGSDSAGLHDQDKQ